VEDHHEAMQDLVEAEETSKANMEENRLKFAIESRQYERPFLPNLIIGRLTCYRRPICRTHASAIERPGPRAPDLQGVG